MSAKADYIPHHQPFQYYKSTANPNHLRPTSVNMIGVDGDQANHQYDTNDFFTAVKAHHTPAVSFLKAPGYQDGHAGYSDPLDEQTFIVQVINFLQQTPEWKSTAVVINYDDSDGWYYDQMGPIVNQSQTAADALTAPGQCGLSANTALAGVSVEHAQGRCGDGPRLPLLVISPYAKSNYVDHTVTDQSSILRFVEDNWLAASVSPTLARRNPQRHVRLQERSQQWPLPARPQHRSGDRRPGWRPRRRPRRLVNIGTLHE